MLKLSERLNSLTKYISAGDKVIDVGCDHALFDIYLVQSEIVNKVYACDVNENALQSGILNIEKYDVKDKVIPILGYGIERASEIEVDTLVISGMGAKNIIEILSSPLLDKFYKLILQANNNHEDLRVFLASKGFAIVSEEIVEDANKSYINMVLMNTRNQVSYSEVEYELGPVLIKDKRNLEYFRDLLETYNKIYESSHSDEIKGKIDRVKMVIDQLVNM